MVFGSFSVRSNQFPTASHVIFVYGALILMLCDLLYNMPGAIVGKQDSREVLIVIVYTGSCLFDYFLVLAIFASFSIIRPMQKPPIDDLFFTLYGFYPDTPGQGFGMLVAAAFKLLAGQQVPYGKTWNEPNAGAPLTETDEKGGVSRITLKMLIHVAEYEQGGFSLIFTDEGIDKLTQHEPQGINITSEIQTFYDAKGNISTTLDELGSLVSAAANGEDDFMASGTWDLTDRYLKYNGQLYGVRGVDYNVPVRAVKYTVVIEASGRAGLFVKSESGEIDKLFRDVDLRQALFKDGKVEVNPG